MYTVTYRVLEVNMYSGTGSRTPSVDSHYDTIGCVVACDHSFPISVYVFPSSLLKRKRKEKYLF